MPIVIIERRLYKMPRYNTPVAGQRALKGGRKTPKMPRPKTGKKL